MLGNKDITLKSYPPLSSLVGMILGILSNFLPLFLLNIVFSLFWPNGENSALLVIVLSWSFGGLINGLVLGKIFKVQSAWIPFVSVVLTWIFTIPLFWFWFFLYYAMSESWVAILVFLASWQVFAQVGYRAGIYKKRDLNFAA